MAIEQITTKIIVDVDARNGRHKVTRHGINRDTTGTFPDAPFQEPAKRADIETILGAEVGLNAEKVTELTAAVEAKDAELTAAEAATQAAQALVDGKDAEIAALKSEIEALKSQPVEETMHAAAFWTAAEIKLGITQSIALAVAEQMPETTELEVASKKLALNVIRNQSTFHKSNPLLAQLISMANLMDGIDITNEMFEDAWAFGLTLNWG